MFTRREVLSDDHSTSDIVRQGGDSSEAEAPTSQTSKVIFFFCFFLSVPFTAHTKVNVKGVEFETKALIIKLKVTPLIM